MNETISEIVKDFSEAFLALTTAVCLIVKTVKQNRKTSKKSKKKKVRKRA